jgi:hypothetical protein
VTLGAWSLELWTLVVVVVYALVALGLGPGFLDLARASGALCTKASWCTASAVGRSLAPGCGGVKGLVGIGLGFGVSTTS